MTVFSNTNNKDVWPVLTLNLEIIGHTGIIRVHPLSTYAKFSEKLTGGDRNVRFLENFAYVLNGRPLIEYYWNEVFIVSVGSSNLIQTFTDKYTLIKVDGPDRE